MTTWPFSHNWSSTYQITYSFFTDILVSRSGLEQRIAERVEPRRSIATALLEDGDTARSVDRFLWTVQADAFTHIDPVSRQSSLVRLTDTQGVDHPTSGIAVAAVTLTVEPGTDTYASAVLDVGLSYQGRYVFPFRVNWKDGSPDSIFTPQQTLDYGRGRISVSRPIAFASRTSTFNMWVEDTGLFDFFRAMRGRQGDFWIPSALDDLKVVETVSTTLTVQGADTAAMWAADGVNAGVRLEMTSGSLYFRKVVDAAASGGTTLLSLDQAVPEPVNAATVRRCSWLRVGRFASDDLTIEWLTNRLAQSQVQTVTIPYVDAEPFTTDPLALYVLDTVGGSNFLRYASAKDYIVNTQIPRLDP